MHNLYKRKKRLTKQQFTGNTIVFCFFVFLFFIIILLLLLLLLFFVNNKFRHKTEKDKLFLLFTRNNYIKKNSSKQSQKHNYNDYLLLICEYEINFTKAI